jgi:hypothetical protein
MGPMTRPNVVELYCAKVLFPKLATHMLPLLLKAKPMGPEMEETLLIFSDAIGDPLVAVPSALKIDSVLPLPCAQFATHMRPMESTAKP